MLLEDQEVEFAPDEVYTQYSNEGAHIFQMI